MEDASAPAGGDGVVERGGVEQVGVVEDEGGGGAGEGGEVGGGGGGVEGGVDGGVVVVEEGFDEPGPDEAVGAGDADWGFG